MNWRVVLVVAVAALVATAMPAAATHIITGGDDFEDGDVDGWDSHSGDDTEDTQTPTVTTNGTAAAGSYAMDIENDSLGFVEYAEINDRTDGLKVHNVTLTAEIRKRGEADDKTGLVMNSVQDPRGVVVWYNTTSDELVLEALSGFSQGVLATTSVGEDLQMDTYYPMNLSYNRTGWKASITVGGTTYWANSSTQAISPAHAGVAAESALVDEFEYSARDAHRPELSNADPSGGETAEPTELSVDVNDPDFASPNGDSVQVQFEHKGPSDSSFSVVDTKLVGSNGTVTASGTFDEKGTHRWVIDNAVDVYGYNYRSTVWTFSPPGDLHVYNETDPDELIDDREVNATFYGSEGYVQSNVTNSGIVSMAGLPSNQTYVARVKADQYETRTLYIPDATSNRSVYLLNRSYTTNDIVFTLDDNTGEFPAGDTSLSIQRSLNKSGQTRYQTITSDVFGASNEYAVTLQNDTRYRLLVENQDGETRVLGPYTTTADDPNAVLPIGQVIARGDTEADIAFSAARREDPGRIVMRYDDVTENTTELYLNITNVDTGTSIRSNTSVAGPFGNYTETVVLPSSEPENATYRVEYVAIREGANRSGSRTLGGVSDPITNFQLGDNVLTLLGWGTVIALTAFTALVSAPAAAIIAPASATLLTWLGALSVPLPLLAVAGAIGVVAAAGGAYR